MIKPLVAGMGHLVGLKNLAPVYLILGATWRCNAHCRTCFNSSRLNTTEAEELSVDEHRRVAKSMGPLLWLLFTGGEPILRDDLPQIAEAYYRHCDLRRITVPTNGMLPKKTVGVAQRLLDACPQARFAVSIAVDGTSEYHDTLRNLPGAFNSMFETYDLLVDLKKRQQRLSINLNTVLMNFNMENIPDLMDFVAERMPDVDFHGFELMRAQAPDPDLEPPSAEEYEQILKKLPEYWSKFPFYRGPFRRWIRAAKIEARLLELDVLRGDVFRCRAGSVTGYVAPEGKVYLCEVLDKPVGDLREAGYDFKKIWTGQEARKMRAFIAEKKCCCTHSCFVASSILFNCGS